MGTTGASSSRPGGSDKPWFDLLQGGVVFDFTACEVCGVVTSVKLTQGKRAMVAGNPELHAEYHEHLRDTIKGLGERIVLASHSHQDE